MRYLIKISFLIFLFVSCKKEIKLFEKLSQLETGVDFKNELIENEKFNVIKSKKNIKLENLSAI